MRATSQVELEDCCSQLYWVWERGFLAWKCGQAPTGLGGNAHLLDSTLVIVLEVDTYLSEKEDEIMRSCRFQGLKNRFQDPEGRVEVDEKGYSLWVQEVWLVRTGES